MLAGSYIIISLDPGGSSDPAGLATLLVFKRDRITHTKVIELLAKPPIMTAQMHIQLVLDAISRMAIKYIRPPLRIVVDLSSNAALGYLLANALPRYSLIAVKIGSGDAHSAGVVPTLVGDVGGRATSLPTLVLSRRQMLHDIGNAFTTGTLSLPLDDPEQAAGVAQLKSEMSRASLKITPAGREVATVNRGHDDVLMALAQGLAAVRLSPPREARPKISRAEAPSAAGWT